MQEFLSSISMLGVQPVVFLCSGLCCWHRYQHIYTTLIMCLAGFDLLSFLQLLNRQSGSMAWKQSEKNQCKKSRNCGRRGVIQIFSKLLVCILKAGECKYIHVSLHSDFTFFCQEEIFFSGEVQFAGVC